MFATKAIALVALIGICQHIAVRANLATASSATNPAAEELNTCEEQLSRYRKFLLQAIVSFEDICDVYNARTLMPSDGVYRGSHGAEDALGAALPIFLRNYQAPEQRADIWAFFKLLMAQFNDVEFTSVIRDAVIERCRIKSQMQRDEKRNSVVLGKKQRFHSWGGKRSSFEAGAEERNAERSYFI